MTKKQLVEDLVRLHYIRTPLVRDAFLEIDRARFVLADHMDQAYENTSLPIGFGQTISQPLTVAFMLELLEPKPREHILDVGAGSGWVAALLGWIVSQNGKNGARKKSGKVFAIERIPELLKFAKENIGKYNFVEKEIVEVILGDGSQGYKPGGPYDKIIAAATAGSIPVAWKAQLKVGGRLVAPIRREVCVARKLSPTDFDEKCYSGFSFVPLITHEGGNG